MRKLTSDELRDRVRAKYPDQELDLTNTVFGGWKTDMEVICRQHGSFNVRLEALLGKNGCGCPECAKEVRRKAREANFIAKVKQRFGDKYGCEEVWYVDDKTPVKLICHEIGQDGKEHGAFCIAPRDLLSKKTVHGCSMCAVEARTMTNDTFIARVREKFPLADFDLTYTHYLSYHTKVRIDCPKHGALWITPANLLSEHVVYGCRQCADEANAEARRKPTDNFIAEFHKVFPERNISFEKFEYLGAHVMSTATCHEKDENGKEHGDFPITPHSLLDKRTVHVCPCCAREARRSNLERETASALDGLGIEYIHGCRKKVLSWVGKQELDFYLPDYGIAIECQGIQHYEAREFFGGDEGFRKTLERDQRKACLCEENGMKLFYIRYDEDVEDALKRILTEAGIQLDNNKHIQP